MTLVGYWTKGDKMCDQCILSDEDFEDDEETEEEISDEEYEEAKRCVAVGFAFLDANYPDHRERFDSDSMDIWSGTCCPLAQAANRPYMDALPEFTKTDLKNVWEYEHGFMPGTYKNGQFVEIAALNRAWREAYNS